MSVVEDIGGQDIGPFEWHPDPASGRWHSSCSCGAFNRLPPAAKNRVDHVPELFTPAVFPPFPNGTLPIDSSRHSIQFRLHWRRAPLLCAGPLTLRSILTHHHRLVRYAYHQHIFLLRSPMEESWALHPDIGRANSHHNRLDAAP